MTQQDLKHLRRADLLELLLEQSRENEALRSEIQQLREQQSQQDILLNNAGSIAEASLRLNGVFEAAQRACDQYTANIEKLNARQQRICAKMEKEARETCRKMMEETRKECDRMLEEAKKLSCSETTVTQDFERELCKKNNQKSKNELEL